MVSETPVTDEVERGPRSWARMTAIGLTGLFYAYAVWNAIAYLVNYASYELPLNANGWMLLLFAVAFPIFVFIAAVAIGRKRKVWEHSVIMLTGLALVAVFWMNIVAFTTLNSASLYV